MNNSNNNDRPDQPSERNSDETRSEARVSRADDLPDNPHDEARMQAEEVIIDMPDVSDIPGQENIHVPSLGELADTTISSDDEEGLGIFGDDEGDEDTDPVMGTDADVSAGERAILARTDEDMPTLDENRLRESELDNADFEGDPLNEGSLATDVSGSDLDTNIANSGNESDAMGQGDEENSNYSMGSDSNDNITEGTP
jgi:hypothetical protein